MICLKDKVILFLLAFTATWTVINAIQLGAVLDAVEEFEPVVIQDARPVEPEEDSPVYHQEAQPAPVQPRITCPLDDDTQQMILDKAEYFNIDFAFTMAVINKESSFNPNADSGSSVGLMQINRINHGWLSKEVGFTDFFDPEQNVTAGLYMLRDLFEKYEDPALVLMAYNMGETGAKRMWDKGIYTSDYAEAVLQQAEIYNGEIQERIGEND
jgi:hypothetical protein